MYKQIRGKVAGRVRRAQCLLRLRGLLDMDNAQLTRLGTAHGGWTLPTRSIRSGSTALCVGAGEDISFDVELNKKGITVYTIDPTPRSREHVRQVLSAAEGRSLAFINRSDEDVYDLRGFDKCRFTFLDVGLWGRDTPMRFFAPQDHEHVSHSIVNLQHTDQWFEANCMTLRSVCESLNIREIDILKLDVEGAEYAVLESMVDSGLRPGVLCVEFDEIVNPLDGGFMERILKAVKMLRGIGYRFRHIEDSNALFVR
jgi:FkbM family methyltransferase